LIEDGSSGAWEHFRNYERTSTEWSLGSSNSSISLSQASFSGVVDLNFDNYDPIIEKEDWFRTEFVTQGFFFFFLSFFLSFFYETLICCFVDYDQYIIHEGEKKEFFVTIAFGKDNDEKFGDEKPFVAKIILWNPQVLFLSHPFFFSKILTQDFN